MIPRGALIVSCQARPDNPLHGPMHMAAMARAAGEGGAGAIRAEGPDDIAAIDAAVDLPVIGLVKRADAGFPVYITPDFDSARRAAGAGADIVAIDATPRARRGESAPALIRRIQEELGRAVLADISTVEEGVAAEGWGANYVATTLSGYTGGPVPDGPDIDLVAALARACRVPVIAEGRFWTPTEVTRAFDHGAHAVCVGTAITNPREITRRFVGALPK